MTDPIAKSIRRHEAKREVIQTAEEKEAYRLRRRHLKVARAINAILTTHYYAMPRANGSGMSGVGIDPPYPAVLRTPEGPFVRVHYYPFAETITAFVCSSLPVPYGWIAEQVIQDLRDQLKLPVEVVCVDALPAL